MKKHTVDQNCGEIESSYFYRERLAHIFRDSFQFIFSPFFLADRGWVFVADRHGYVVACEKAGQPEFDVKPFYPLHPEKMYIQNNVEEDSRTVCVPVLQDVWFPGYIGVVLPACIEERCAFSFLQGMTAVFRLIQEQYISKTISSCIKAVSQNMGPNSAMQTIVRRFAESLYQVECIAVVFDEEQDGMVPHWSSSEQNWLCRETMKMRNLRKIYEQIVSQFSVERNVLRREDIDIQGLLELEELSEADWLISPFDYNDKIIGFLVVLRDKNFPFTDEEQKFIFRFTKALGPSVHNSALYMRVQRDEQKRSMMFEITKKLHSSINVNDVLHAVIENTKKLYPEMQVDLWLSHDSFSTKLPVKPFSFSTGESKSNVSARAFMEARTIIVKSWGKRSVTLAAPLRGKQGVYGVLELYSDKPISLPAREIEYITMLADTAGNAFENAQLYQQSCHLIKELLLIDEMTRQLNKNIKLNDLLTFITRKLTETFRTEHCCIFSWSEEEKAYVACASTGQENVPLVLRIPEAGKLHDLFVKKESILIADTKEIDSLLPSFSCRSLMAVPLMGKGQVEGAIFLIDSQPNRYTFDDFKRLEMLARHVKVAVTNASLHAEVERMVITDNLTGLYNRKYLYDCIRHSQQRDICGSLILIDVDYFKNINDTYGHQIGDEILIQVAEVLVASIRTSDVAARWGGEEMAVYLPAVQEDIAHQVAERLRMNTMSSTRPAVTISCGVATWLKENGIPSVERLFQQADEALYRAKHSGRNQVCLAGKV
ncbi:diguanylate cyclase [Aneurinibacillus thermoaerophilus]|uniref:sensor domain-containing diguanylate cyclase n=1 Tax=Aneurinibacillus thermoaerophilus TaxID=143495 RepID=UPI002E1C2F41|nr:diguanylate cyclase [Aneurinibacillus thermoaerophilus]MED0756489.1 diguanylate cyclase [Aneurinibacillus thermoaerophilus]MED0761112.1 diguanylate cyclase [Aneurinibacillus thermoaerophilus]